MWPAAGRRGPSAWPPLRRLRRHLPMNGEDKSVLVGIELACPCHRHSDGLERVHDSNRAGVVLEHLRQALVGLRRLVGVSSANDDAAPAEPTLHVLAPDAARVSGR